MAGGFIGTLRLGINVVEALDFILGWVGIDILQDDAERRKLKEQSNQAAQTMGPNVADPGR